MASAAACSAPNAVATADLSRVPSIVRGSLASCVTARRPRMIHG
jgi:hypothetical protein